MSKTPFEYLNVDRDYFLKDKESLKESLSSSRQKITEFVNREDKTDFDKLKTLGAAGLAVGAAALGTKAYLNSKSKNTPTILQKVGETGTGAVAAAAGGAAGVGAGLVALTKKAKVQNASAEPADETSDEEILIVAELKKVDKIRKILRLSEDEFLELLQLLEVSDFKTYKDYANGYKSFKNIRKKVGAPNYQKIGYIPIS